MIMSDGYLGIQPRSNILMVIPNQGDNYLGDEFLFK